VIYSILFNLPSVFLPSPTRK